MFTRGHRFIVTESSAKKRRHPAIGDIGYLRNAAVFKILPSDMEVIIVDAYFSKFAKDPKPCRCEKKTFILGNSLSSDFAPEFIVDGIRKRIKTGIDLHNYLYFSQSLVMDDALQLLQGAEAEENTIVTGAFNALFPSGLFDAQQKPKIRSFVICSISPTAPTKIHKDRWEREAWVKSIRSLMNNVLSIAAYKQVQKGAIYQVLELSKYLGRYTQPKKRSGMDFVGDSNLIEPDFLKMIQHVNNLQSYIAAVIKAATIPGMESYRQLLQLLRRYENYNAALDHINEVNRQEERYQP